MHSDGNDAIQTVFYVEDEPVNALLMGVMFERRPVLRLQVATCGAEALAMARQMVAGPDAGGRPALLLLDLRLPDCIGTELLFQLRALPGWQSIPAVAVTAESRFDVAGTGFLEVWRKPIDLRRTLARLDALVGPGAAPPERDGSLARMTALTLQPALMQRPRLAG